MNTQIFHVRLALSVFLVMSVMLTQRPANAVSIRKCVTIAKRGFYTVSKDITGKGGDCLIVTAPNVTLFLNNYNVTGTGDGIGLHIMSTATGFRCHGGESQFTSFNIGVEDDADGATIEGEDASNNADTGIFVNGANGVTVGRSAVNNNGKYGIHVLHASHTMIHNYGANSNGGYGVFIEASHQSLFDQFQAGDGGANGIAGVFIGCSVGGPGGFCNSAPSSFNVVSHGSQDNNTHFGLVVDGGSEHNVLANTLATGNTNSDEFDGNANCDSNLWFFNVFHTSNNPSCMNQE
jgi:hypothetical protein